MASSGLADLGPRSAGALCSDGAVACGSAARGVPVVRGGPEAVAPSSELLVVAFSPAGSKLCAGTTSQFPTDNSSVRIGRHKMIPRISPGKTWEGFFGALFFSQLAACGLFALFPTQLAALGGWPHVIILGFVLALLAVVGDLAESVVKRSLGAKDSGNMLPGIGGALDLIDSLCFTAPVLYFYLKWVTL